jgi:hypothetical protein
MFFASDNAIKMQVYRELPKQELMDGGNPGTNGALRVMNETGQCEKD